MATGYLINQIFWLVTFCFLEGVPPRCDISLLLEYLNYKEYEYYLALGYADSCVSVMTKIASDFGTDDMVAAVKSLSDLHYHNQSDAAIHEPSVINSLQAQDIQCSFNNMHPVLISFDLNVTIIVDFDNRTNQLTVVLAESLRNQPTHFHYFYRDQIGYFVSNYIQIFTTLDMGRGLLHFVYQNNNESLKTGHDVLQIKNVDSSIRIMKIRSERIRVKFSQLIMDPSGTYMYYTVFGKDKQQSIHWMKVDYPNFTFAPQKPLQAMEKLFILSGDDQIFPIDRNALLVWKLAGKKRSAWLYEGSCTENSECKNSLHQIGCILSGINDPDGRLLVKIHRVRRHL